MKKLFLILAMVAFASVAWADCWVGGTYTLDPNATAAELWMITPVQGEDPAVSKVIDLAVPADQFIHTFAGVSNLDGKTFFIKQTFPGGVTNDSAAMASTSVIPASITHILSGCE
jgi:hypothetical protein